MKLNTFVYIAVNLLIFQLISLESSVINGYLNLACGLGIITLGVAHGSVDNVLFLTKPQSRPISNKVFISIYLLLVFAFLGLWLISIDAAFLMFLVISAYHFGQSQFEDFEFEIPLMKRLLYLSWGGFVLSLPFLFWGAELLAIASDLGYDSRLMSFLIAQSISITLVLGVLLISLFIYQCMIKKVGTDMIFKEFYVLVLIVISFKLLPPFIGFALFFVFIHSLKVIAQEYQFCFKFNKVSSLLHFIKLCLPLTLVSIAGIIIISGVMYYYNMARFIPSVLTIVLSGITFPHALVMERFYSRG